MTPNDLNMDPRRSQGFPKWSLMAPKVTTQLPKSPNGLQCEHNGSQDPPKDLQSLQKVSLKAPKDR